MTPDGQHIIRRCLPDVSLRTPARFVVAAFDTNGTLKNTFELHAHWVVMALRDRPTDHAVKLFNVNERRP